MSGQERKIWLLNEYGVYEVIFRSNKPEARSFKKWVKTVIKTIRQTGQYSLPGVQHRYEHTDIVAASWSFIGDPV